LVTAQLHLVRSAATFLDMEDTDWVQNKCYMEIRSVKMRNASVQ